MDPVEELLSQIPMDQLAQQLGTDAAGAEQAARQALPALLGGMQANAQDAGGAASLERALGQHAGTSPGRVDLSSVDTADGEAIVGNVFGGNRDQVINTLGGQGGGSDMMSKLLPLLAPLVMSWLAGKVSGSGQASAATGGGGLGDLLGGMLGGGGGSAAGGDMLGDLLGGLLGGGRKA